MTRPRALYVQYTNPAGYPPLAHSAWMLAEAGFEVRLLGVGVLADELTLRPHANIRTRLLSPAGRGWVQKAHYAAFCARVVAEAVAWRPTWIYASDPLSAPAALMASVGAGGSVVYHEHDSPSNAMTRGESGTSFMRRVMDARRRLARRAAVCVLPNAQRAEALRQQTGAVNVVTAWNCPLRAELQPERSRQPDGGLRVFYHGSIVPARLPLTVIEALAQLPSSVSVSFAGYETAGHPHYVRQLCAAAEAAGIADRVRYLGIAARHDLLPVCAASDVGLSLLPAYSGDFNEETMVGASNKPFDYLACGLPVVVPNRPDWVGTFVDAGVGRACDAASPSSIAGALRWFLEHPAERRAMAAEGRRRILDEWNYEHQFRPVLRRLTGGVPNQRVETPAKQMQRDVPCSR